jgi:hypothetical protein
MSMLNNIVKTLKKIKSMRNLRNDDDNQQNPSNHTLPGDIPSNIPSHDPSSIPRNILAFRTITMMLAILKPKQTYSPDSDAFGDTQHQVTAEARQQVRISDALAHLAIIRHEVVALATEYSPDGMTVVACPSTPDNPPERQPKPEGYMDQVLGFLFTKNPRKDDPPADPVVTYPKIISAKQPDDMGSQTLREYIEKLDGT